MDNREVTIQEILFHLWMKKRLIVRLTILFTLAGVVLAIISPSKYTASSTFVSQTSRGTDGGGLKGLASLAGFNIQSDMNSYDIIPELYPKIVGSLSFRMELMEKEIPIGGGKRVTYAEYYEQYYKKSTLEYVKEYTIGLPFKIIEGIRGDENVSTDAPRESEFLTLSESESNHVRRLKGQLDVNLNLDDGSVILKFEMPTAKLAASMAHHTQTLLQERLIDYRLSYAQNQLTFTQRLFNEKRAQFEIADLKLADFNDRNIGLSTSKAKSEQRRLQAEFDLAFNVYNELAGQLERAKLKVSEDTPIFLIMDSVSVPTERSSPRRMLMVLAFMFLGGILSVLYILFKYLILGMVLSKP